MEKCSLLLKGQRAPPESRKEYGQQANIVKEQLTASYETALKNCLEQAMLKSLETEKLDISLPGMIPLLVSCILQLKLCAIFKPLLQRWDFKFFAPEKSRTTSSISACLTCLPITPLAICGILFIPLTLV